MKIVWLNIGYSKTDKRYTRLNAQYRHLHDKYLIPNDAIMAGL